MTGKDSKARMKQLALEGNFELIGDEFDGKSVKKSVKWLISKRDQAASAGNTDSVSSFLKLLLSQTEVTEISEVIKSVAMPPSQ